MRYSFLLLGVVALLATASPVFAMAGGTYTGDYSYTPGGNGGSPGNGTFDFTFTPGNGGGEITGNFSGPNGGGDDPVAASAEPVAGLLVGLGLLGVRYLRRR